MERERDDIKEMIIDNAIWKMLDKLDKYMDNGQDDKFEGVCQIIDYLGIDYYGYTPFRAWEKE